MYYRVVASVRTIEGETDTFPITTGLHQKSALSPYLFALVIDNLTWHIQDEVQWYILFANNVVLIDTIRTGRNYKSELWREVLV